MFKEGSIRKKDVSNNKTITVYCSVCGDDHEVKTAVHGTFICKKCSRVKK